jgi:D-alanine-D-alanine ligase
MQPRRILILAGGRSDEHDVSIVSARSVLAALRNTALEAEAIVISREGRWLGAKDSQAALEAGHAAQGGDMVLHAGKLTEGYDAIFPLVHGPYGEDGTLQGLLEMADLPYVGSGVLASALCMDKPMAKEVLRANGVPQVDYVTLHRHAFAQTPEVAVRAVTQALAAPWFVKPANLGSSVGISKVRRTEDLHAALVEAFRFDRRVIVEAGVPNVRELEVAVLGNAAPEASPVGEITYEADFYDYAAKYSTGTSRMHIPAKLPADIASQCQLLALKAYMLLDCAGFARVDLFYAADSRRLYINELNTIPGFTPHSMFPKLWEAGGVDYPSLIGRLVEFAIERHHARPATRRP